MTEKKILVVEDHKDSCLWISAVLRQCGYMAMEAGDGDAALRIVRLERPDVILLDMHLPRGSGETVLECLQQDESLRTIPVIIMSGDTDLDEAALQEKGAVAVYRKPVDVHAFLRAIKEWAGKKAPSLVPA